MAGTVTQLTLATLVVLLLFVLQTQAHPYRHSSDSYLAMAVTVSLFVELFCCNLYKWTELVDQVTEQDALLGRTTRILSLFELDSDFITGLVFFSITPSLVFALGPRPGMESDEPRHAR